MGVTIGTPFHYPSGTPQCLTGLIATDNPPDYTLSSLAAIRIVAGVITWEPHLNVEREAHPTIPPTPGKWHYPQDCPYGLNPVP